MVFSAATDGRIAAWNLHHLLGCVLLNTDSNFPRTYTIPDMVYEYHSAGVNSLQCCLLPSGDYCVVSGGDDQVLAISSFNCRPADTMIRVDPIETITNCSGHCSSVTAVSVCDSYIFSCSTDQRLIVWHACASTDTSSEDKPRICLKMIQSMLLELTDISTLHVSKWYVFLLLLFALFYWLQSTSFSLSSNLMASGMSIHMLSSLAVKDFKLLL